MTRSSGQQPSSTPWLIAGLLVAAVTAAVALTTCGGSELPTGLPKTVVGADTPDPAGAAIGVEVALQREAPLASKDTNRGQLGARQLAVHVEEHQRANQLPVRVELLFGERDGLRTVNLFVDREGNATWPSGSEAPRPRFADFAFPTVSATGKNLSADATEVRLTMPPTCVLEIQVHEVDGRATGDPLTTEVRSPTTAWPQNRWRAVPMQGGRAQLLAEAAGGRVEVRVRTASGRHAEAVFHAAKEAGQRVPCILSLAPTNGVELALQGMPADLPDSSWRVEVHDLVHAPVGAHRWPGSEHRYVMFPSQAAREAIRAATQAWLVLATDAGRGELYWGRTDGGIDAPMRRSVPVVVGRVVDQAGEAAPGFHVDLVTRKNRIVLVSVVTGRDGRFELLGPDPDQVSMDVVLREARAGKPAAVPLPADGELVLQLPH